MHRVSKLLKNLKERRLLDRDRDDPQFYENMVRYGRAMPKDFVRHRNRQNGSSKNLAQTVGGSLPQSRDQSRHVRKLTCPEPNLMRFSGKDMNQKRNDSPDSNAEIVLPRPNLRLSERPSEKPQFNHTAHRTKYQSMRGVDMNSKPLW